MRSPTSRSRSPLEFNMTPMIDVVLQLIVFFLVSGHLAQQESHVELDLPGAISSHRPQETEGRRIVVNVLPAGEIQLSGKPVGTKEFEQRIRAERERDKDIEVRIRSDRRVPYQFVEPILVSCAKAGVWKVTFAVTRQSK